MTTVKESLRPIPTTFVPGDHVKGLCFGGAAFHHAIFDNHLEQDEKQGFLIHYTVPENQTETKSCVRRTLADLADYQLVYRPSGNEATVLIRAQGMVGVQRYNIVFNNCEHFVNWCVTGQPGYSMQIINVTRVVGHSLVGGVPGAMLHVAIELGPPIYEEIKRFLANKTTSAECAGAIVKHFVSEKAAIVAGGIASAFGGGALGLSIGGPIGAALVIIAGGYAGAEATRRLCLYFREHVLGENGIVTLENAYRALKVNRNTSVEEIERSFRRLARMHHPDPPNNGDPNEFIKVKAAMDVIRAAWEAEDSHANVEELLEVAQQTWVSAEGIVEKFLQSVIDAQNNLEDDGRGVAKEEATLETIEKCRAAYEREHRRLTNILTDTEQKLHGISQFRARLEQTYEEIEHYKAAADGYFAEALAIKEEAEADRADWEARKISAEALMNDDPKHKRQHRKAATKAQEKVDDATRLMRGAKSHMRAAEHLVNGADGRWTRANDDSLSEAKREERELTLAVATVQSEVAVVQRRIEEIDAEYSWQERARQVAEASRRQSLAARDSAQKTLKRAQEMEFNKARCMDETFGTERARVKEEWGESTTRYVKYEWSINTAKRHRETAKTRRVKLEHELERIKSHSSVSQDMNHATNRRKQAQEMRKDAVKEREEAEKHAEDQRLRMRMDEQEAVSAGQRKSLEEAFRREQRKERWVQQLKDLADFLKPSQNI